MQFLQSAKALEKTTQVGGIPLGITGIYVGIVAVVFYSGGGNGKGGIGARTGSCREAHISVVKWKGMDNR